MTAQRTYKTFPAFVQSANSGRHGRSFDAARIEPIRRPIGATPRNGKDWRQVSLSSGVKRRYDRFRAQGWTARSALAYAHALHDSVYASKWDWSHDGDSAMYETEDGLTVTLSISYDEYPDISWIGTFTNRQEDGAISNRGSNARHAYEWFVPGISVDEHRKGLRNLGYSRHAAWVKANEYVHADMIRARELSLYDVSVTVSLDAVKLGWSMVGSVDFSDDSTERIAYAEDLADDLEIEALDEARQTMATITGKVNR